MTDRTRLILSTVLGLAASVPGCGAALMAPMMFDAPGSLESRPTVALALLVVSFPALAVLCPMAAWIAFAFARNRLARTMMLVPVLPPLLVLMMALTMAWG